MLRPIKSRHRTRESATQPLREAGLHIFIDESGTFTGIGADTPAVSTLGALILTSHRPPQLFSKYKWLRANFPKRKGEVKGSLLNEAQVAAVVELGSRLNGRKRKSL